MSDSTSLFVNGDNRIPPQVPGFDLIRSIGKGAFGEVWLAANQTTGQLRAVKIISTVRSGAIDPAGREITSIKCLEANLRRQHTNLLSIHHVGEFASHIFIVMDLADNVTGEPGSGDPSYQPATLLSRLKASALTPAECWRRTGELVAGLAALHDDGMVHRDVKPANCLFVRGELKLADFGLLTEANRQMSRVGTIIYMPPDGCMDMRADVYAAGLTIYEMMTGLPPNCFPSLGENSARFADDPHLLKLNRVVLCACQSDRALRFQNAREIVNELIRPEPAKSGWMLRRASWIGVGIVGVLLAAILMLIGHWPGREERVRVNFVTVPFEATIQLDGLELVKPDGTPYNTPCTIPDLPAGIHHIVFKRELMSDLDIGQVNLRDRRDVEARWDSGAEQRPTSSRPQEH